MQFFTNAEWYFSWGYSKQFYAPTDIHVSQPALGNDFTIHGVRGHDEFGLNADPFGPQYNLRVGRFINAERTIAVEMSFDHSKFTSTAGQTAHISGLVGGAPVNGNAVLDNNTFRYMLHNGANHLMGNLVYRAPLVGEVNTPFSIAAIGKIGAGIMLPHTSNTVFGNSNNVGPKQWGNLIGTHSGWWQFDGWTAGAEAGLRFQLLNPVYLEITDKVAYARLYDLPAYQGTMKHSLWMNAIVVSLGVSYDGPK